MTAQDEYHKDIIKDCIRDNAKDLVRIFVDTPFQDNPTLQVERLKDIAKTARKLAKLMTSLVPENEEKRHDIRAWNTSLTHEIVSSYQALGHLKEGQNNDLHSPVAQLLPLLREVIQATELTVTRLKPPRGRSTANSATSVPRGMLVHRLIDLHLEYFASLPVTTGNGWPTELLEEVFEKNKLGGGANHLLRKMLQ